MKSQFNSEAIQAFDSMKNLLKKNENRGPLVARTLVAADLTLSADINEVAWGKGGKNQKSFVQSFSRVKFRVHLWEVVS